MKPWSTKTSNLSHFLRQAARRHPESPGLIWGDDVWTWAHLDARVDALATELASRGVNKGDRVLVQLSNCNQLFETMFACFRTGAIWVPTNFRQTADEVAYLARSSGAVAMVCGTEFPDHVKQCAIEETIIVGTEEAEGYDRLIDRQLGTKFPDAAVDRDDPCWFFYTSGTTGRPKAAVLTHGQMAFVTVNHLCDLFPGTDSHDASLVVAPMSHGAGIHMLAQVARGVKSVLLTGKRFDPSQAWALIERWGITNVFTVPTILKIMVEDPAVDRYDHSSLRYVIYAGAPMYREDQKFALKKLGPVLVQYFGLGEVTGAITVLRPEDHDSSDGTHVKIGTCGRERTGMEISIQGENGEVAGPGVTGEICVAGPAVFSGYFNNDEANAKAFRDGWFRTGDMGHLDDQGDLFITGRASDMYISGGSNVYPREIEEIILAHPSIAEVAVVGVPDSKWGEVGLAFCVSVPGESIDEVALLGWIRNKVAAYKLPRQIVFREELPKSGYGKVAKAALKKILEAESR